MNLNMCIYIIYIRLRCDGAPFALPEVSRHGTAVASPSPSRWWIPSYAFLDLVARIFLDHTHALPLSQSRVRAQEQREEGKVERRRRQEERRRGNREEDYGDGV
jgi:hypothetical protein